MDPGNLPMPSHRVLRRPGARGKTSKKLNKRPLAVGASKVYVEDLREVFVKDYIFPMLRANAVYEGYYLLGTSIARPLIARRQIEIAKREKAQAVGHGSTGKGNDQVRFELTYMALGDGITIIAPWRRVELSLSTRPSSLRQSQEDSGYCFQGQTLQHGPGICFILVMRVEC